MKKSKIFIHGYCFIFITITSSIGWILGGTLEKYSHTRYEASLPLQLSSKQFDKNFIEQMRFKLLYENNTVESLAKLSGQSQETLAGNLKLKMDKGEMNFKITFLDSNPETAKEIVLKAKNALLKNQYEMKETEKITVSPVSKLILKSNLIGGITGLFFGVGILSLFYQKKLKNHK
jgi:hypothetical protein